MTYSISLNLRNKQTQSLKQLQRLIMSRQMKQAIQILQLPVMELSQAIELELEQNPLLEYIQEECSQDADNQDFDFVESEHENNERDLEILKRIEEETHGGIENETSNQQTVEQERHQAFLENTGCTCFSLFEHLMQQAKEIFRSSEEISMAEALIGNFNESGFLKVSLEEIAILNQYEVSKLDKILETIQTFHPPGVGAIDLKQSLLIQLCSQGKGTSLAYQIVDKHFEDLVHNRIPQIQKGLNCSLQEIAEVIEKYISRLQLHPGTSFGSEITPQIVPDLSIRQEENRLVVELNEDSLPPLRLNSHYLKMLNDEGLEKDVKEFICQKILSAKWLLRNILQRNDTLEKIAELLIIEQKEFFLEPNGQLVPMTMKYFADELQLHESTIARAISNKYIHTPRGLLPLRFFFTNALVTDKGDDISSRTVREFLIEIIAQEDKNHPLSDEAISNLLKAKGIHCARRTVAKYRTALNIGNTRQRKKYST